MIFPLHAETNHPQNKEKETGKRIDHIVFLSTLHRSNEWRKKFSVECEWKMKKFTKLRNMLIKKIQPCFILWCLVIHYMKGNGGCQIANDCLFVCLFFENASQTEPSLANVANQLQLSDGGAPVPSLIPTACSLCSFFSPPQFFLSMLPWTNQTVAKVSALMNTKIEVIIFQPLSHLERQSYNEVVWGLELFLGGIRYNST